MFANFVAEYIQECLKEGINNPSGMRSKAEEEIKSLQKEIDRIKLIKERQQKLRAVIKNLGGGNCRESNNDSVQDFKAPENQLPDSYKSIIYDICDEINVSHPKGVEASKIIHEIAKLNDHKNGYSAIQWLGFNKIITRDPNDRSVIKGPRWGKRPVREN